MGDRHGTLFCGCLSSITYSVPAEVVRCRSGLATHKRECCREWLSIYAKSPSHSARMHEGRDAKSGILELAITPLREFHVMLWSTMALAKVSRVALCVRAAKLLRSATSSKVGNIRPKPFGTARQTI